MICDSFKNNFNPKDIAGNIIVTTIQKMKYTPIVIEPLTITFDFTALSNIMNFVLLKRFLLIIVQIAISLPKML